MGVREGPFQISFSTWYKQINLFKMDMIKINNLIITQQLVNIAALYLTPHQSSMCEPIMPPINAQPKKSLAKINAAATLEVLQ